MEDLNNPTWPRFLGFIFEGCEDLPDHIDVERAQKRVLEAVRLAKERSNTPENSEIQGI